MKYIKYIHLQWYRRPYLRTSHYVMWIRIRPYELEEIRRSFINNLYQLAGFFFGEESLDAAVLGGIARLDCCDEVRFSFGGYMDQTIQFALFRKGDEHEILSPENRPKV